MIVVFYKNSSSKHRNSLIFYKVNTYKTFQKNKYFLVTDLYDFKKILLIYESSSIHIYNINHNLHYIICFTKKQNFFNTFI